MSTATTIIIILSVFIIFEISLEFISKPFEKKIENSSTTTEALLYRKRLKIVKYTYTIVFIIIYLLLIYYYFENENQYLRLVIIGIGVRLLDERGINKWLLGNVSSYNKEKYFNKHPVFAVFLRAFERDEHNLLSEKSREKITFHEYDFIKAVNKFIPTCAIGIPKEVHAPFGATRIYVNNSTWQDEVSEIIDKASVVFILISNRPSCIWEIEQCLNCIHKTFFIVEQLSTYNAIRTSLIDKFDFPDEESLSTKVPFCLAFDMSNNGRPNYNVYSFQNTTTSYEKLLFSTFSKSNVISYKKIRSYITKKRIKTSLIYIGLILFFILVLITIVSIVVRIIQ